MKRWQTKPLGEVSESVMGQAPPGDDCNFNGEGTPFVKAGEFGERRPIIREWTTKPLKFAKSTDVLVCVVGATCGKLNLGADCAIGRSVAAVRPNPSVLNQGFLFAFLQGWTLRLRSGSQGSAQGVITRDMIGSIPIPVPPLPEQEQIVKLLDEADALRKLRQQADRRTAQLIPALFHEMFGDPATNNRGWPTRRLRDLSTRFSDGPFGSNLKSSHYTPEGVRVIRLQNIGVGRLVDDDKAYVAPEHFASLRKHECLPGDVIVGTLGDPNLRACILPETIPQALNKADCVQIRPDPHIATAAFVSWLLNLPGTLEMAKGMIHGQTRARISMGRLAELVVPVPPLPLQQKFAQRVTEIRAMEAEQAASRQRLEALFQSMLHRAFNGEL